MLLRTTEYNLRFRENGNIFIDILDNDAFGCLLESFESNKKIISVKTWLILKQILDNYTLKRDTVSKGMGIKNMRLTNKTPTFLNRIQI